MVNFGPKELGQVERTPTQSRVQELTVRRGSKAACRAVIATAGGGPSDHNRIGCSSNGTQTFEKRELKVYSEPKKTRKVAIHRIYLFEEIFLV